jgi:hypothetical protein
VGVIGSYSNARKFKAALAVYLRDEIGLTLSFDKTKLTPVKRMRARFLGFDIRVTPSNKRPLVNRGRGGLYRRSTRLLVYAPILDIARKLANNGIGAVGKAVPADMKGSRVH